jgi:hypothetical protein
MDASEEPMEPLLSAEARRSRRQQDRSERERRRRLWRRGLTALLVLLAALVIAAIAEGGGGGQRAGRAGSVSPTPAARASTSSAAAPASAVRARPVPAPAASGPIGHHSSVPSAGSLPQTHAYPSGSTAHFKALMAHLWEGVVQDSVTTALPAFFPKAAYVQLKAIYGAASDWNNRLLGDYRLDIGAAHALLGRHPAQARLVAVRVLSSYGHWIEPGVCDNGIGYYEMPNARVIYREGGRIRSFGIASMISWRGVWYVVHLGAVLRSSDAGLVDQPALGAGTSEYSGTC